MCSYPVMSTGNPTSTQWAKYGHLKHDSILILVECRALWGEPEWDICSQRKYTVLHTVSNAWISDFSYNTGTELTGWSRHAYHWWHTLHTVQHIMHQYTWTAESALRCPCCCYVAPVCSWSPMSSLWQSFTQAFHDLSSFSLRTRPFTTCCML